MFAGYFAFIAANNGIEGELNTTLSTPHNQNLLQLVGLLCSYTVHVVKGLWWSNGHLQCPLTICAVWDATIIDVWDNQRETTSNCLVSRSATTWQLGGYISYPYFYRNQYGSFLTWKNICRYQFGVDIFKTLAFSMRTKFGTDGHDSIDMFLVLDQEYVEIFCRRRCFQVFTYNGRKQ